MNTRFLRSFLAAALAVFAGGAFALSNGLVISQVYGGGGNAGAPYSNDFIEVFNAGTTARSVAGYSVQYASSAGTTWQSTALPSVTLQPGQYLLVQEAAGTTPSSALPTADATGSLNLSGTTGKVALVSNTTALVGSQPTSSALVDLLGWGGANGYETAAAPVTANATSSQRGDAGCTDTDNNSTDFTTATPVPRNSASPRRACGATVNAPIVASCPAVTLPAANGGTFVATATDADGIVSGVTLLSNLPSAISIGAFAPAASVGGTASQSFSVATAAPGTVYAFTLQWSNNQAQTVQCVQSVTLVGVTPTYRVQGSGMTSPYLNQSVLTEGVVTKINSNGFFIQDPTGDADPATSDGLFVFTNRTTAVSVGQRVVVAGTVQEFNVGTSTDSAAHTVTELGNVGMIQGVGTGSITPVTLVLPLATRDAMEAYEGMLVTLVGPLTVSQNYFLGQYGQLSLSSLGRLQTPTNAVRPGPGALALEADNQRRLIVLDDGSSVQNPNPTPYIGAGNTVRAGDTLDSVTGVMDYGLVTSSANDAGAYKIHPSVAPVFTRANPRTTAPDDVGGNIKVAAANVLNFFTTFTNGATASGQTNQGCSLGTSVAASNCRGADSLAEYQRQVAKIVEELAGINADAVGLMELQNDGDVAAQTLVNALNARLGASLYAVVPAPVQGTGTDAIRVGMIYKPSRLTLVGASVSNTDPINNRAPFAQTFAAPTGDKFTLVVNHLKSKGSCPTSATDPDADQGDLQGCFNATRVKQAQALRAFVTGLQASQGTADVLMVGDFNAYAQEDPITTLTGTAGYVDQIARYNAFGYSYQFNSESGRIDHAITTPSMSSKVTKAIEWHINADEPSLIDYNFEFKQPACPTCGADLYSATPYRASDHDPVVIGLQFGAAVTPARPPVKAPVRTLSVAPAVAPAVVGR